MGFRIANDYLYAHCAGGTFAVLTMLPGWKQPQHASIRPQALAAMRVAGMAMWVEEAYRFVPGILRRHARADWPEVFDTLRKTQPSWFVDR